MEQMKQGLSACGRHINTAFVERLNLDMRQRVAAVGRRVNTLCKGEDGLQHQLVLFQSGLGHITVDTCGNLQFHIFLLA